MVFRKSVLIHYVPNLRIISKCSLKNEIPSFKETKLLYPFFMWILRSNKTIIYLCDVYCSGYIFICRKKGFITGFTKNGHQFHTSFALSISSSFAPNSEDRDFNGSSSFMSSFSYSILSTRSFSSSFLSSFSSSFVSSFSSSFLSSFSSSFLSSFGSTSLVLHFFIIPSDETRKSCTWY